jgi:hypothetical protein
LPGMAVSLKKYWLGSTISNNYNMFCRSMIVQWPLIDVTIYI